MIPISFPEKITCMHINLLGRDSGIDPWITNIFIQTQSNSVLVRKTKLFLFYSYLKQFFIFIIIGGMINLSSIVVSTYPCLMQYLFQDNFVIIYRHILYGGRSLPQIITSAKCFIFAKQ